MCFNQIFGENSFYFVLKTHFYKESFIKTLSYWKYHIELYQKDLQSKGVSQWLWKYRLWKLNELVIILNQFNKNVQMLFRVVIWHIQLKERSCTFKVEYQHLESLMQYWGVRQTKKY